MVQQALDPLEYRRIMSHYQTGVCVVTALADGVPVGMVVGSFTSVSLESMLVAFLPARRSSTWPRIKSAGHFCVNVLAQGQRQVCQTFASKSANKFEDVSYRLSDWGVPIIEGVVAWVDCELHAVHEAGDHFIVVGRVRDLNIDNVEQPLVFARGEYGTFAIAQAALSSARTVHVRVAAS